MTTPTTTARWPTPYILEIYNAAVQHGHIRIEPLTAEQAKSLTQTIYRFRRRSDTSKAAFMRPEFSLITVSPWVRCDASSDTGYMHVVFSADPDQTLPRIVTPSVLEPILRELPVLPAPDAPRNITDFVQQMLEKSGAAEKE
jgi:hypothetical protein